MKTQIDRCCYGITVKAVKYLLHAVYDVSISSTTYH